MYPTRFTDQRSCKPNTKFPSRASASTAGEGDRNDHNSNACLTLNEESGGRDVLTMVDYYYMQGGKRYTRFMTVGPTQSGHYPTSTTMSTVSSFEEETMANEANRTI